MNLLCTIGARNGSKGVPRKNLRSLMGKPLIAHTIGQAQQSELFQAIAVSSDSEEILDIARQYGADVLVRRPLEMATDVAPKLPAILHCFETAERQLACKFPVFVDLDVSSPLRLPEDIAGAVNLFLRTNASSVITGAPARHSPYFDLVELDDRNVPRVCKSSSEPIVRRQDAPRCFDMNGSVYVWRRDAFIAAPAIFYENTRLYEMPPDRSIDINSPLDWEIVEYLMTKRHNMSSLAVI